MTTGTGTFVARDGVALAYRLTGQGPLLVCQPGGPGRASSYLGDLGGLSDERTLLLLDSRGTGASDHPEPALLTCAHLRDDLEDLRAHLGVESFELLGHSAGAVVAQCYAALHPDRVERLLLVTPSGRLQGVNGRDVPRRETYGIWNDVTATHAAACDAQMNRVAESAFYDDIPAGVPEALRTVQAPALVVAGSDDPLTPVAAAEAVAACLPNATLKVLDGLGHYPWVEQPADFVPVVKEFLDSGPN